jgi:hypothetical protein
MYVDLEKGALTSCDGIGFKKLTVKSNTGKITFEGTDPDILFNEKNTAIRTQVNGKTVYNYEFNLTPRCVYVATKEMGYNRGSYTVTFETDSIGNVVKASDVSCRPGGFLSNFK